MDKNQLCELKAKIKLKDKHYLNQFIIINK